MADFWKSNAKFWCKFCKIYITDNKITRKTHDAGTKHKENVERFLRDQNQRSRDKIADEARLKKEMDAIEKAAQLQYQKDVEAGLIAPSPGGFPANTSKAAATSAATSTASPPPSATKEAAAASSSTSTPASPSPSATKAPSTKDESTSKVPVQARDETIGQPGQWQTVERPSNKRTRADGDQAGSEGRDSNRGPRLSSSVQGADLDDEEADPEDLQGFKIVEKTWPSDKAVANEDEGGDEAGEGGSGSMFKKRKGNASKTRNIRKKT